MTKTVIFRTMNFIMLSVMLPFVSGCNGGGGSASSGGSLFGASSGGAALGGGGGAELASIHQPEPMTMVLVGGGMMAMAYMRKYKK